MIRSTKEIREEVGKYVRMKPNDSGRTIGIAKDSRRVFFRYQKNIE